MVPKIEDTQRKDADILDSGLRLRIELHIARPSKMNPLSMTDWNRPARVQNDYGSGTSGTIKLRWARGYSDGARTSTKAS